MNNHYLYFHINPLKNEIFYVGIGSRADRAFSKTGRNKFWHNTINKYGYIVNIVETNLTKEDACQKEQFFIKKIGRHDLGLGNLVNMTEGGECNYGRIVSESTRDKMRYRHISKETRAKMSKANIGKKLSQETKDKISEVLRQKFKDTGKSTKGFKMSPETKEKMSISHTGHSVCDETREKLSKVHKGKTVSDETKEKQSKAHKGKVLSAEHRKKISDSLLKRKMLN